MTPEKRYKLYLDELINDQISLDSQFRNLKKLFNLQHKYSAEIEEILGSVAAIVDAMQTSILIRTHRLFDSKNVSVKKLINFGQEHLNEINWYLKPPKSLFIDQLKEINDNKDILDKIKNQRHKNGAHLEPSVLIDFEKFNELNYIDEKVYFSAIKLSGKILQEHYRYYDGAHKEMKLDNSVKIQNMFELLRSGIAAKKEYFKSKF